LSEKLTLARGIVESIGFSGVTGDFLAVLVRHGRVGLLPRIAEEFASLADSAAGFLTAEVRTARLLDAEQRERLSQALSRVTGIGVRLRQTVDPELLAGASVTVGGRTFDGSVAGGLERLRHRLAARAAT
jgi:F-type H+-transporting ATPase subunit delta